MVVEFFFPKKKKLTTDVCLVSELLIGGELVGKVKARGGNTMVVRRGFRWVR